MSASNYARQGGGKSKKPIEIRFFGMADEVPRFMLLSPWVWWTVPRGFDEVRLVGEAPDERCVRLSHGPRECEACRAIKQRSA